MLSLPTKVDKSIKPSLRVCTINKIINETPTIKSFFFSDDMHVSGGQFVMVWVPGVDEIPMSVAYTRPGSDKGITVAKVGEATGRLHEMVVGSKIGIRGPYGNGFNIENSTNILAVSGGCGSAPLGPVLENAQSTGKTITFLVGARTKSELLFKSRVEELGVPVEIATDDGSEGYHGFVTNRLHEMLEKDGSSFDLIMTCGPEVMMTKVVDIAYQFNIPVQASLERYMKCGIGICDSCTVSGFQVCRDGPVFSGEMLQKIVEFGKSHRDECGRNVHM